tara:strand:+ start:203 stop:490 length:288 start_codon:yes stop_codon:yes gene_type:complete
MDVWDPKDKTTVFSQIKDAISGPVSGFKRMTRVILWGSLSIFYFFIFFLLLSGCSYIKSGGMQDDNEIIITDLPPFEEKQENVIACIKMEEACGD